jgi:hypothetical protein
MANVQDEIERVEEVLRQLKNKYDQFFAGIRKMPPTTERRKLDATIHEMGKENYRDNAKRFRFNTVLSRYNQYREMWSRKMREREEGPIEFKRRQVALNQPLPEKDETSAPLSRVTSAGADTYVKVQGGNGDGIEQILQRVRAEHEKLGKGANVNIEQLRQMVQKQAEQIRTKYNVVNVAFRVETVDGKVKLKAKPIQD